MGLRVPYLLSGFICLIIYLFRLQIKETLVFDYFKRKKLISHNPIRTVFKYNMAQLLRTFGLVCMGSTFYFFCFIYIPIFLTQHLHFSIHKISMLMSCLIGLMIITVPLAGFIVIRWDEERCYCSMLHLLH